MTCASTHKISALCRRLIADPRTLSGWRRALLDAYASAQTLMAWNTRNEPVSTYADYRDYTLVCATDPYAYKSIRDIGRAYLRRPGPTAQDKRSAELTEVAGT